MGHISELSGNISGRRWIQYIVFWAFSFWFLARYFSIGDSIETIDWIYTFLFHFGIWFGVAVNSFVLIPRLLAKGYTLWYIPLLFGLIEACIQVNLFTFNYLADLLFPSYYFISYYERLDLFYFMIVYLGITSLIQFSKSWFKEADAQRRLAEIQKEKTAQELRALRSQIQPHFLFNSLNTIYGLIRKKSPMAEEAILQLADLLRYTIQQGEKDEVPLSDEVEYLKQYTELQKMRLNNPDQVQFETQGDMNLIRIIPLLLIVFVENGFKYADLESGHPLQIRLQVVDGNVRFSMKNRIKESGTGLDVGEGKNGTGIANAEKRLNLYYRDRYELDINQKEGLYILNLEIETEEL